MLIYRNKRTHLHEKRDQLPEDCLGTPTRPPFHCSAVMSCENALGSGEKLIKYQAKYILCDHVLNSHDHSVLQSIAIRKNLMLITLMV